MRKSSKKPSIVFGVDILPSSSPQSSKEPHYALVILKNGEVWEKHSDVALRRIIRLAWEYKPEIISIDNIFELGANERNVVKIISMLPPETSVVQVNVSEEKISKLWEVAKQAKLISEYSKFPPLKTAYLAAILAYKGYGSKVKVYEEKTKIIITKGRSLTQGGMSQLRYRRHVRGLILQAVRKIKEALEEHGIDYDLVVRKTESGFDGAVFTVYAPRTKLYGIVSPMKGHDIRVIIRPVYRGKIEFEHVKPRILTKKRPLIVGIDPGMITGVAILDIDGEVLRVFSGKNIDRATIVKEVEKYGKPLIIASDVFPPPEALEKLASTLRAKLYTPQQSLSQSEKEELVKTYLENLESPIEVEDTHQRDALAAAINAWKSFRTKLEQIENYVSKMELDVDVDKIKADVIKGLSIAQAVEKEIFRKLTLELKARTEERKVEEKTVKQPKVSETLLKEIKKLEKERAQLKERLSEARKEILELKKQLELYHKQTNIQVKTVREIQALSEEVRRLSEELKKYEKENLRLKQEIADLKSLIITISKHNYRLAIPVTTLTLTSLSKAEREYGPIEKDSIIYVINPVFVQKEALSKLVKAEVLSIIAHKPEEEFTRSVENQGIPVLKIEDIKDHIIQVFDDIVLYNNTLIKCAKEKKKELKEELRARKTLELEDLIMKYRLERWG